MGGPGVYGLQVSTEGRVWMDQKTSPYFFNYSDLEKVKDPL